MKALTIRGIEPDVAEKLRQESAKHGKSINQFALECFKKSLGLEKEKAFTKRYDDLDDLFGKWSEQEYQAVQGKIDQERIVDEELWR